MRNPTVVSLFDESGNMGRPWAERGAIVHCFDILNEERIESIGDGLIVFHNWDLTLYVAQVAIQALEPDIIFAFPPCTDLAVSGAAHFESKAKRNPNFQKEAVALARVVETIAGSDTPFFAENPVSVLSTMWRKPDESFHPWEYGGYLPEDDTHPRWPDYIAPRDRYRKKTCLWTGNGFVMPPKKSVGDPGQDSAQHSKLGGKSAKTKQIRSETPRGFAQAVMEANYERSVEKQNSASN